MSYSLIPSADYKAACDAIRAKTGKTALIKSGDMAAEIGAIEAGGSLGEIIAYNYGRQLPDVNEVWKDELKERLPYALIKAYTLGALTLVLYSAQIEIEGSGKFVAVNDTEGVCFDFNINTNKWDNRYPHDGMDFVFYAGDPVFSEGEYLLWTSEPIGSVHSSYWRSNSDSAPVYSQSGGGGNGGNVVNPDKSGVIKFDLKSRVGQLSDFTAPTFFKLNDEPFRTDPNLPISLNRIVGMNWELNPWISNFDYEQWKEREGQPQFIDPEVEVNEGYEVAWADDPPASWELHEFYYRVTAESVEVDGITLSKGIYANVHKFVIPISFEIAPPTE